MRRKIQGPKDLEDRIVELENRKAAQSKQLQEAFRGVAHELSPAVLIRKGVQTVVETPGLKTTAAETAISAGAGFLGRKLVVRGSNSLLRKLAGAAVQFIIMNVVRNKLPGLKSKAPGPAGK